MFKNILNEDESSILSPKRKKTTKIILYIFLGVLFLNYLPSLITLNIHSFILLVFFIVLYYVLFILIYSIVEFFKFKDEPIFFQKLKRGRFYFYLFLFSLLPYLGLLFVIFLMYILHYSDANLGVGLGVLFAIPLFYILLVIINFLIIAKYERAQEDKSWIRIVYSILLFTPIILLIMIFVFRGLFIAIFYGLPIRNF